MIFVQHAGAFVGDGSALTGMETGQWSEGGGGIFYDGGNIGIGTTTPGAKLEVAGTIRATGLEISGSLSLPGSDLIFLNLPDARTSPADADLETVVVDKATGRLYMQ